MKYNVCFVTAELAPLAKAGGLADVSAALTQLLHADGHDVRTFLPLYADIDRSRLRIEPVEALAPATLALGELMGSNAANIGLVLGIAAVFAARALVVDSGILAREVPLSLGACLVLVVVVLAGSPRAAGPVLLVGAAVVVRAIVTRPRTAPPAEPADVELSREVGVLVGRPSVPREWARTLIGLVLTLAAAQAALTGAVSLAERLGIAEGFVGLAIIAVGTSLPELVTAISGIRRREDELVIGNVLGSNLTNSLLVGGVVVLLAGETAVTPTLRAAGLLVTGLVLLLAAAMGRGLRVSRAEGALLLLTWLSGLALVYAAA